MFGTYRLGYKTVRPLANGRMLVYIPPLEGSVLEDGLISVIARPGSVVGTAAGHRAKEFFV